MKYFLSLLLAISLVITSAYADTCSKNLMPPFTSAQAQELCATFIGTATLSADLLPGADNTYDLGSAAYSFASIFADGTSTLGPVIVPSAATSSTGVLLGASSLNADVFSSQANNIVAPPATVVGLGLIATGNDNGGQGILFEKTRSTSTDANTIVQSGDFLADMSFYGADGAAYKQAAAFQAVVDGTPGTNDMPGAFVFKVSADGSTSPVQILKLGQNLTSTFAGDVAFSAVGSQPKMTAPVVLTPIAGVPTPGATNVLTGRYNAIATAAPTNAQVNLPLATPNQGESFAVFNESANPVAIVPQGGDAIRPAAALTPFVCTTGKFCDCTPIGSATWFCRAS